MSTTYIPFLGVGSTHENFGDVAILLVSAGFITDQARIDDLEELSEDCGLTIKYFHDCDLYFVGIEIDDNDDPLAFANDIIDAAKQFKANFKLSGTLCQLIDSY